MIANIIPEKRSFDKDTYSYIIPSEFAKVIKTGSICHVPFGKKVIRGVVEGIKEEIETTFQLKEIINIDPISIPEEYINLAKWISNYYLCSLGEAVALFLPPKIKKIPVKQFDKETKELDIILNSEQETAYKSLLEKLLRPEKPALLYGVTGSGKTEIYLKLTKDCLDKGKQAVILVPEIMLTPQTIERFEKSFPGQTCLIHSQLNDSERYSSYFQFRNGLKNILVGPRSALLVPSKNLGLIVVDEEQEDSYKQEKAPRYHAIKLAERIANNQKALLVLGSATPRVETYYKAQTGAYDLFILNNRYHKLILPPSEIVDLKSEIKQSNFSPISQKLRDAILNVLKNKKQVLLFLNRRGISTFVSCRDCGYVEECPSCNIPLVYHINDKDSVLSCHHCNYSRKLRTSCPNCKSVKYKFFGIGIEKIEQEIKKLFPKASTARIDSQSTIHKDNLLKIHNDMKNKKIDILIGTQILAKGLDLENIDLVGIISADVGMHLPHFRAMEKTLQTITQVSGRSGRKHNSGQTIIQTYWPNSKAIQFASQHNFENFYHQEIIDRKKLHYPPFTNLIRVVAEDKNSIKAKKEINRIALLLKNAGVEFIGPGKCFYEKIRNKFRYHLLIKSDSWPNEEMYAIFKANPYLIWDAEPIDLL